VVSGGAVDERSDLYSLGGLAYFLLTSHPVFRGATMVEICASHLYSPVVPPSQCAPRPIPGGLEALVLACLEKEPQRRPSSAEALALALEAILDAPPWSSADARAWWTAHGGAARRSIRPGEWIAKGRTLEIDLRARART
jgi:serine/threonine protein kinase